MSRVVCGGGMRERTMKIRVSVVRKADLRPVGSRSRDHIQAHVTESAMMITTRELLDTSVAQLRTLAAFVGDHLGECGDRSESGSLEVRACKEMLLSLRVLILKLQAARHVIPGVDRTIGRSADCDDG